MQGLQILDQTALDQLEQDVGKESAEFLISHFKTEIVDTAKELVTLSQTQDLSQLEIQSHGLKSAAKTFGAIRLSEICRLIEEAAKGHNEAETIEELMARFSVISEETLKVYNVL